MKRANRQHRGFTLMEATVALAVFTVGMLGLGGAFSQIVHANAISRQKQIAVLLAERKLSQFRMTVAGELTRTTGAFEGSFDGYTWEAQFDSHSQDPGIVDVWVKVAHRSGTKVWLWSQMVVPDD
ncbi:MAG: prepilin-type N-terminal cleavage/methylation domain-containing protein [Planctomycetes bacterium]|nr:prepilin-type N-terminal cleavage/methylation domain-containing protein [Planctomycetota bacterium]